jgi:multidrug efflux system membrane fusion protein
MYGSRGTYVYVITDEDEAMVRDVILGPTNGTWQAIKEGLVAGEAVVLEGLDRLRNGRKVIVTNEPVPADS